MVELQISSISSLFDLLNSFPPSNMINSIENTFGDELENTDPKELRNKLLVFTGLYIIGKKIKGSGITSTNN